MVRRCQKVVRSQLGFIYVDFDAKVALGLPCLSTHLGQFAIYRLCELDLPFLFVMATLLGVHADLVGEGVSNVC